MGTHSPNPLLYLGTNQKLIIFHAKVWQTVLIFCYKYAYYIIISKQAVSLPFGAVRFCFYKEQIYNFKAV